MLKQKNSGQYFTARRRFRGLQVESLENRLYLSGTPLAMPILPDLSSSNTFAAGPPAPNAGQNNGNSLDDTTHASVEQCSRAVKAINQFALDLYQNFERQQGNLFLSPMSIATALAMAYAGARGETAAQMADVLGFGSVPGIENSFHALLESLNPTNGDTRSFALNVANALWTQQGAPFNEEYLQLIQSQYDGGSQPLDFISQAEQSRQIINDWVANKTHDKIKDVLPRGFLSEATRLVLTNAIYFKGQWATKFESNLTYTRPFYLGSGDSIDVSMMHLNSSFRYTELNGYQVLDMPYEGDDLSMVIMLPRNKNGLNNINADTLGSINDWLNGPSSKNLVYLSLPKFKMTVLSDLNNVLSGMGMSQAFDPNAANFSGMSSESLYISKVLHKAFVEVNEEGTEAAAATAIGIDMGCFAAGTPVLTPEGSKPIEEIQPGDIVLSRNEFDRNGEVVPKRVEQCFVHDGMTLEVHVGCQIVHVTKEHPFYVHDRGWIPAGELQPGDLLATKNSEWKKVDKVIVIGETQPVYNFRVADFHTYFLGGDVWGFSLWVHNSYFGDDPPPVIFTADHAFHFFIRDNHTGAILFMGRMTDPSQAENSVNPTGEKVTHEKTTPPEDGGKQNDPTPITPPGLPVAGPGTPVESPRLPNGQTTNGQTTNNLRSESSQGMVKSYFDNVFSAKTSGTDRFGKFPDFGVNSTLEIRSFANVIHAAARYHATVISSSTLGSIFDLPESVVDKLADYHLQVSGSQDFSRLDARGTAEDSTKTDFRVDVAPISAESAIPIPNDDLAVSRRHLIGKRISNKDPSIFDDSNETEPWDEIVE